MSTPDPLYFAAGLVSAALAGRVLIACLPAEGPDRRQIPVTWAASFYLGWAALALELHLAGRAGVAHRHLWLAVPWVLVALGRGLTLPGAMAPRHAPREEAPGPAARALALALVAWLTARMLRAPRLVAAGAAWLPTASELSPAVHLAAVAAFVLHGLRVARRRPAARLGCTLALTLTPALWQPGGDAGPLLLGAALLAAGAAHSIAWLRRANRRALALALLAFGLLPLGASSGARSMGLASLVALVLATPAVRRRRTAFLALPALGFWLLHEFAAGCPPLTEHLDVPLASTLWIWWAAGLLAALRAFPAAPSASVDRPGREHGFLGLQVALCLGATALLTGVEAVHFVQLTPIVALSAGLALPAERPGS